MRLRTDCALLIALIGGLPTVLTAGTLTAAVRQTAAGPMLYVNGRPTAPATFFVNFDAKGELRGIQLKQVEMAGKQDVDIVSFPAALPWVEDGEEPDFREMDRRMEESLRANPNILVLPRIGVSWPGEKWQAAHRQELMVYADGTTGTSPSIHSELWRKQAQEQIKLIVRHLESKYPNSVIGYHPCGQNTGEWFYEGLWDRNTPGFEPQARKAFRDYVRQKYRTNQALREAWGDPNADMGVVDAPTAKECLSSTAACAFRDPALERKVIDFFEFQSTAMADSAELMCKAVKEAAPEKLALVFYGYHFELSPAIQGMQSGGHLALGRLLRSPYVDVVCSPVSYLDRQAGGGGLFMAPVDSVNLHGKMWLIEDDTRTHLCKVEVGLNDARDTSGVLARNFAHILTRGNAVWWMDLWGEGWFADEAIWSDLGKLRSIYSDALPSLRQYKPEIAVIVDDPSCLYLHPSPEVAGTLIAEFRKQWYRIGAPAGIYLLEDLVDGKVPPARMYVFINAFALDDRTLSAVRKHACRKDCMVVWMYAPGVIWNGRLDFSNVANVVGIGLTQASSGTGSIVLEDGKQTFDAQHPHLTPSFAVDDPKASVLARYTDGGAVAVASKKISGWTSVYCGTLQMPASLLREQARKAGIHIYSDSDDIVMVGNGFVCISASVAGTKTLRLPAKCRTKDCKSGEILPESESIVLHMLQGDTRIFSVE